MPLDSRLLRDTPFKQQLNIVVTVGVLFFALASSLLTSWQGSHQIRRNLLEQGEHIAGNLASQSKLALLYASAENADVAIRTALSFPDVMRVEIRHASGRPLIVGGEQAAENEAPLVDKGIRRAYLETETGEDWRFVAPVLSEGDNSPFAVVERKEEVLGFVRVVQSKATLSRMLTQIFLLNLAISLVFAVVFLFVLRKLADRLTRPITELSEAMARTERGESNVRAGVGGPKDIRDMAQAFNSMIATLQEREQALRESKESYSEVVNSVKEVIFQTNAAGELSFLNMTWVEITGIDADQAIGQPMAQYFVKEDRSRVVLCMETLNRHEASKCRFEARYPRQDGSLGWFDVAQRARYDAAGRFAGTSGTLDDITEQKHAEERIHFLAYHDALTRLPNRMLAQDRFEQAMALADRAHTKVALIFLDLDNFKTINDSLGHLTGDELLKEVTRRLTECVRDTDTISRLGGDEFLVILPALHDADAIAPVIVNLLARMVEGFEIGEQELNTSASIGIALYPDDGTDFDALLKKSDMAMYRAKDAGRNTYRFFDDQMNVEAVEHLRMRNGLRKALERDEFVLHYQPQINIANGTLTGAEALIRWNHPEMGIVAPARFIPIAEDSGLIVPIGEWVLYEACRQAAAWGKAGIQGLVIAVNLSAVQFRRGDIEQSVIRALEASSLDPTLLELELTESILITDSENVLATVQRLKRLGVKLSIDDFGTGYSSLSYLKRFQVDKLKIDQSFVRDLVTDAEDAAIVRAIIQMADSFGLKTIAEGVETEHILRLLREFGCDEAQGYYFARPMPAGELPTFRSALRTHPQLAALGGRDLSSA
ncbi:MAG: EAL domain-containing protein [Betaproteobacteria bacterium]|nr:EAL domain-containing protein [Betaproteobacteria bacterium]